MNFKPSKYQQAILDWVTDHRSNPGALIVEAVAGSGKTTTIVEAAHLIPVDHKAVFLAFNKSIATELAAKLPDHVESKTLNALGWALCRARLGKSIKIDRNKTRDLIRKIGKRDELIEENLVELLSIIGKAKSHGLIPIGMLTPSGTYEATSQRWITLMERYDIEPNEVTPETFTGWASQVLRAGLEQTHILDFDDQLYMPVALDLGAWRYDWIIVDEAQDVSHVQRTLVRKFLKSNGRLIAVGDSHQAIYGFRGADSQSMANMGRVFKAETLPLSISYRCPTKVIEIAQSYVPHIQASDTADDGEVLRPTAWDVASFSDSDLVVCRNTAPLIELAYKCISEGRPVRVLGREIGKGLINVIKKAGGVHYKGMTTEDFHNRLGAWSDRMVRKAGDDDAKRAAITDKVECLQVLSAGLNTVGELVLAIDEIFSDDARGTTLATVHKAKGLEAVRVFILEPSLMPSPWARKEWQQEQERNLQYVAVTRALETLIYLPLGVVS